MIAEQLRQTRVYDVLREIKRRYESRWIFRQWELSGRPLPPPAEFKQEIVKRYARKFGLHILVETGTFHAEMIAASWSYFREIYSVELSEELYRRALRRFGGYKHIHLFRGDSAATLRELLPKLTSSPLIWLDAHYSGPGTARGEIDTPIAKELETIFEQGHIDPVILIDDARDFDGSHGYPDLASLREMVMGARKGQTFEVKDDIIRISGLKREFGSRHRGYWGLQKRDLPDGAA